jgi:hypothetical protein
MSDIDLIMGGLSGIENAYVAKDKPPFLQPGAYLLEVRRFNHFKSFKTKSSMYNVTFKVLESVPLAPGQTTNPVGSIAATLFDASKVVTVGNIKKFVMALTNQPEGAIKASEVAMLMIESPLDAKDTSVIQPVVGFRIRTEVGLHVTEAGKTIATHKRWTHVPPDKSVIAAARKEAGLPPLK